MRRRDRSVWLVALVTTIALLAFAGLALAQSPSPEDTTPAEGSPSPEETETDGTSPSPADEESPPAESPFEEPDEEEAEGAEGLEDEEGAEVPEEGAEGPEEQDGAEELEEDEEALEDGALEGANVSLDLTLQSVEAMDVDLDDDEEEFLRFTFSGSVLDIEDESAFLLIGIDPEDVVQAETAELDEDDDDSVIVGFPSGTDVDSYTLGAVENTAVGNRQDDGNIQDSAEIDGEGIEGVTNTPELVGVDVQPSLDRIVYEFDEDLDEDASGDASSFGYYTEAGIEHSGAEVITIEDEEATVEFDADGGSQVEDAERFFVAPGAVSDRAGNDNVAGATGGRTTVPDLIEVDRVFNRDTQFDFTFDEDVSDAEASELGVYTSTGELFEATDWTSPDDDTIRVTIPDIDDFSEESVTVGAVLSTEAVTEEDHDDARNTIGVQSIGDVDLSGDTAGPDLVRANLHEDAGEIVFKFDEKVDDDQDYSAEDFVVVTAAGDLITGDAIAEVRDDAGKVIVIFDENDVEAADGVTVNAGAVQDFVGNPNPVGAIEK